MPEVEEVKKNLRELVLPFARKVQPIYQQLNWTWQPDRIPRFVPQVKDIEETLCELIDSQDNLEFRIGTGGLQVFSVLPNEFDSCGHYGLKFEFCSSVIWSQGGSSHSEGIE